MSQQQAVPKPTLQGVRIRDRKRTAKATAKHEPEGECKQNAHPSAPPAAGSRVPFLPSVFRDQFLKYLDNVPPTDFDAIANKLVQAGSTLEFLKYAEALFEILLVGGLLQPGGQYVTDGASLSPFSILNAKEPVEVADVKQFVEVFNKLMRR